MQKNGQNCAVFLYVETIIYPLRITAAVPVEVLQRPRRVPDTHPETMITGR